MLDMIWDKSLYYTQELRFKKIQINCLELTYLEISDERIF